MVCFELFARPAIGKMKGRRDLSPPVIRAIMENHLYTREGYRRFIPVAVNQHQGQYFARLIRGRRSSEPSAALTHYNGLAILPEGKGEVREGDEVEVLMLHRAEEGEEVNSWIF
jgi:molybdopterin biosynthesis enzyme